MLLHVGFLKPTQSYRLVGHWLRINIYCFQSKSLSFVYVVSRILQAIL